MPFIEHAPLITMFTLTVVAFVVTVIWTPALTHFLYKHRLGKQNRSASVAPIFAKLHAAKVGTPTMGGVLIWGTAAILAIVFWLADFFNVTFVETLNFISRRETYLPLGALLATAIVGLIDDIYNVRQKGSGSGLRVRHRLLIYIGIAIIGAWWFYFKLQWTTLHVPFVGNFDIGAWYVPLFVLVIVSTAFSVNEADGLDGLAGGILLAAFSAFAFIAFAQGKYVLAGFLGVLIGSLFAFLWFNIHPARFFMGDTGAMSLGTTLGIVAMLTNSALLLPIIGILLVLESGSVLLQLTSKRLRGKKIFLSSPLHHHLEAVGWPETKIVMRSWIIAAVFAVLGVVLFLVDR
jgi:phospho-N-acetylmuramoyl-pentapeptide-transferase